MYGENDGRKKDRLTRRGRSLSLGQHVVAYLFDLDRVWGYRKLCAGGSFCYGLESLRTTLILKRRLGCE